MRTARPHWPPHTHMQHWWSATPDLLLFHAFSFLWSSLCQCMCCHCKAPAERRFLWQKWTVQPLSHQPIVDSDWLHPSRISCQVATTSSALHNDHRVAGHCLPKFMALKTWPTSSQHNILGLLRLRILMSSSVNFFQFLWSFINRLVCTLPLRPLKSSGGVVPPATPPSPVALLRPWAPLRKQRDGARPGRAPA